MSSNVSPPPPPPSFLLEDKVDNDNNKEVDGKEGDVDCWRSSISVLILILTLVSTGRGRQIHLASKIPFYLL